MITSKVTKKQLAEWQKMYLSKRNELKPNRISGKCLNDYFVGKYSPDPFDNDDFKSIVCFNAAEENKTVKAEISNIASYVLNNGVLVGIDLASGFFYVESKEIKRSIPIWDDLFVTRGLSESDLDNYVLTAQYISLLEK